MSDPRFTDPRFNDPVQNQPVLSRGESVGGVWGWVAGLGVIALIAFIIVAGWNSNSTSTATGPGANPPMTTGSAPMRNAAPPTTTGSGATSPAPAQPAPNR